MVYILLHSRALSLTLYIVPESVSPNFSVTFARRSLCCALVLVQDPK